MFNILQSARIKLTLWYLLIIATISGVFSVSIYQGLVREIEQGYNRVEARFIDEQLVITPRQEKHDAIIAQNIKHTKQRIQVMLLYADGIILVGSGAIAYYLAGQSLAPIAHALSEQKRFIEDASHELKTPLTALKVSIEVALRNNKASKEEIKSVLEENLHSVNSLQTLTEDMLRLSQYNEPRAKQSNVEVGPIIQRVIKSLSPLANNKHITIQDTINSFRIKSRTTDLEKLFSTIIDNSIAYTQIGGKIIIMTTENRDNGEILVGDTGVGIDNKDIPHIFDRFYRADRARSKRDHKGFGLGLPIAKQIVNLYGGSIEIKSKIGKGTLVKISFPLS